MCLLHFRISIALNPRLIDANAHREMPNNVDCSQHMEILQTIAITVHSWNLLISARGQKATFHKIVFFFLNRVKIINSTSIGLL